MAKTSAAPSKEILEAALQGLEAQREKLDEQIAEVRSMMGVRAPRAPRSNNGTGPAATKTSTSSSSTGTRKKRTLSPEARKRIAVAQKKRWAAFRKNQE